MCIRDRYNPLMSPDKKYSEVNAWSVTWGIPVSYTHLAIYGFKIQRDNSRTGIVFQEIIRTGITEQFGKKALASHCIPVASP